MPYEYHCYYRSNEEAANAMRIINLSIASIIDYSLSGPEFIFSREKRIPEAYLRAMANRTHAISIKAWEV